MKVTCQGEWPNCLVSKEKPYSWGEAPSTNRGQHPCDEESSYNFLSVIVSQVWYMYYFKSISTLPDGYTERKMRCRLVNHVLQVTGIGSSRLGFWSQVAPALSHYQPAQEGTHGRKNVVGKREGRGPQDIFWVCFREEQMEALENGINEIRITHFLLRKKVPLDK